METVAAIVIFLTAVLVLIAFFRRLRKNEWEKL
jgi:hypothetical protein